MAEWLGISLMLNRGQLLLWSFVGLLLALLFGGGCGYHLGGARGDARVAMLQQEYKQAELDTIAASESSRKRDQARADHLASELVKTQQTLQAAQITQIKKVPYVTTVYIPTQASMPVAIPRPVFTTGFVRVWDSANGIDLSATRPASCLMDGEAGTRKTLDSNCLRDSGISEADILNNHIDNAARCREIEAVLDKYIAWHQGELK